MKCPSVHIWSDQKCIRSNGHDGLCWGKAQARPGIGTLTRTKWRSADGKFVSHHAYHTIYPKNFQVATT